MPEPSGNLREVSEAHWCLELASTDLRIPLANMGTSLNHPERPRRRLRDGPEQARTFYRQGAAEV